MLEFSEIEKLVASGKPLHEKPELPETQAFSALTFIFKSFEKQLISKEQASDLKQKAQAGYQRYVELLDKVRQEWVRHGEFWRGIEASGTKYALDRTLENADDFVFAVYRVGLKKDFRRGGDNADSKRAGNVESGS